MQGLRNTKASRVTKKNKWLIEANSKIEPETQANVLSNSNRT